MATNSSLHDTLFADIKRRHDLGDRKNSGQADGLW